MSEPFSGLTMPVFTAFGWAGEEAAINFALTQLELFVQTLSANLPREAKSLLPYYGLDKESQTVYLAAEEEPQQGAYIAFYARPMSLEVALHLTDKESLKRAFKKADSQTDLWYKGLTDLSAEWTARFQQMEYDEDSGQSTHYQDLFKDSVVELDLEQTETIVNRAAFLNSESKWVVPVHVSRRIESEKVAAMGWDVIKVMRKQIDTLTLVIQILTAQISKKKQKSIRKRRKVRSTQDIEQTSAEELADASSLDQFVYVSDLQPLHLRRGFINLTPNHWPFFAKTARSETREVLIKFSKHSATGNVWRLVPNDLARLVLPTSTQLWLEEHFDVNDQVQVQAVKVDNERIEVTLSTLD